MDFLLHRFLNQKDNTAIIENGKSYTYDDLNKHMQKLSIKLKDIKGKIVAFTGSYTLENIALFLALALNKNIIVPLGTNTNIKEKLQEAYVEKLIQNDKKDLKITTLQQEYKNKLIHDLQAKHSAGLILFSSGSTSKPKAILHNLDNIFKSFENKKQKSLKILLFLLFDHIGGLNTLLSGLYSGSCLVITDDFNVEKVCKIIQDNKVNVLPTTPSFLNLLLISKEYERFDLSSLRVITYGTERMNDNTLLKLKSIFKNTKFIQTFGTSETGIISTSSKSSTSTFFKFNNGDFKIVDKKLFIKSNTQYLGYLNSDYNNFEGYFDTGDLVDIDENGFLKIIGRSKQIINVGGNKVLSSEVENALMKLDFIQDAIVYAEQNSILGQIVVCDIVCNLDKNEAKKLIRSELKNMLEPYKIPAKINLTDHIKLNARFKKELKLN